MIFKRREQEPHSSDGPADPSRRHLLKIGVLGAAGLALSPSLASAERFSNALASLSLAAFQNEDGWILSPIAHRVWPTRNWWPIFESRAIDLGLPRLHDENWPAELYDRMLRSAGRTSDIQAQAQRIANNIIENRPETRSSAGYCPWVAAAQLLEEEPQVYDGEDWFGLTSEAPGGREKIKAIKEGLLVLKHSGDPLIKLQISSRDPELTTRNLISPIIKGRPVIVDLPASMGSGIWFRALLGINPEEGLVKVTNFGPEHTDLPISGIRQAYMIYIGSLDVSFNSETTFPNSPRRFRNLDKVLIDKMVY